MIAWLRTIQLTVTQWITVSIIAVLGALVFIVRLQGSKIHKLQVDLLEQQFNDVMKGKDKAVSDAYTQFSQAYKAYKDAGGQV